MDEQKEKGGWIIIEKRESVLVISGTMYRDVSLPADERRQRQVIILFDWTIHILNIYHS